MSQLLPATRCNSEINLEPNGNIKDGTYAVEVASMARVVAVLTALSLLSGRLPVIFADTFTPTHAPKDEWLNVSWVKVTYINGITVPDYRMFLECDSTKRTVAFEHPRRGPLLMMSYVESKYLGAPIVRFDVLCRDHSKVTGRGAVRFSDSNTLVVTLRFKSLDGSFANEEHVFKNASTLPNELRWVDRGCAFANWVLKAILAPLCAALIIAAIARKARMRRMKSVSPQPST